MNTPSRSHRFAPKGAAVLAVAGLALGASMISATSASAAPGDNGDTVATVAVDGVITLTDLTPGFSLEGTPRSTQTNLSAVDYNVETNNIAGYHVTVMAAANQLVPGTSGNSDRIPVAALTVRESATEPGTYTTLGGGTDGAAAPVAVHTQDTRSAEGGDALSTDFQMQIPFVNTDTYHVTLNYLASTGL